MLTRKQAKAFRAFYDSARKIISLPENQTILIHLAAAMAFGCYPWMNHYLGVARELGISEDQIGSVEAIVMAVAAGRVNAQFREAQKDKNENHNH